MLYILDASAILNEPNFQFDKKHKYLATPEVVQELKSFEVRHLTENALHHKLLKVQEAHWKHLDEVKALIKENGFQKLSNTDMTVLALAKELHDSGKKPTVLTDDYSIQNFLALLEIPFASVIMPKIKDIIQFELKCANCDKKFSLNTKLRDCDFCGGKIRRKRALKRRIGSSVPKTAQ
jgi:rRNA maturation endonuclease Nob1